MNVEILNKYTNETFEDFEFKINKRVNQLEDSFDIIHIKISNFKDTLICTLIYKKKLINKKFDETIYTYYHNVIYNLFEMGRGV